tara:strand:- start:125 stop:292 length:168 start_codon:yes stop_codon:yes gene_type:complete
LANQLFQYLAQCLDSQAEELLEHIQNIKQLKQPTYDCHKLYKKPILYHHYDINAL